LTITKQKLTKLGRNVTYNVRGPAVNLVQILKSY